MIERAVWEEKQRNKRASWNQVGERDRESMKGHRRRKPEKKTLPIDKFGGCTTKFKERTESRKRQALTSKLKDENHSE